MKLTASAEQEVKRQARTATSRKGYRTFQKQRYVGSMTVDDWKKLRRARHAKVAA